MKSFDVVPIDQIAKRFADAKRMDTREAREGNSARGSRKAAREGAIRRARPRTWHDAEEEITAEVHFLGGLVAHPPVVVEIDTPIAAVREHLLERRISAVVVVDGARSLRGIVTRTDVLRAAPGCVAADAMSPFIFMLPAVSRIERAAALMAFEDVAHVVVTGHDSELVGLVSAVDIARHYAILSGFLAAP